MSCFGYLSHCAESAHACDAFETACEACGRLRRLQGGEATAQYVSTWLPAWQRRRARYLEAAKAGREAGMAARGMSATSSSDDDGSGAEGGGGGAEGGKKKKKKKKKSKGGSEE